MVKETTQTRFLTEASRASLISKAKGSDTYDSGQGNRWTRKNRCSLSNTVADYNSVDMDSLFKKGSLKFKVKVVGETNNYEVLVVLPNAMKNIQQQVKKHNNKMDATIVYQALAQALNGEEVQISCTCPDYQYRLSYFATKEGTNSGKAETRASTQTNPNNTKGLSCKHINAALNNIEWLSKIASVIANYINYCKDEMQFIYSKYIFPAVWGMPYEKAVQMSLSDYDEKGEIKTDIKSDENILNLANALGKVRGRYQKGSNRNPVRDKRNEPAEKQSPQFQKKNLK